MVGNQISALIRSRQIGGFDCAQRLRLVGVDVQRRELSFFVERGQRVRIQPRELIREREGFAPLGLLSQRIPTLDLDRGGTPFGSRYDKQVGTERQFCRLKIFRVRHGCGDGLTIASTQQQTLRPA